MKNLMKKLEEMVWIAQGIAWIGELQPFTIQ